MHGIAIAADEAIRLAESREAVEHLKNHIQDWKGHDPRKFGKLLLFGDFNVQVGKINPSQKVCL